MSVSVPLAILAMLLAVAFGVGYIYLLRLGQRRIRAMVEQWAAANEFQFLDRELVRFWYGPFFWTTSKNQSVFRISVQDASGSVRHGWLRCGGFFLGSFTDRVEVRWDHKPAFPVVPSSR